MLLANNPFGVNEDLLESGHGISRGMTAGLIRARFALRYRMPLRVGDRTIEVAYVRITEAGRREVEGVEAEPVLIGLDRAGVAVHSGSACSSESIEPSPVLEAMGVDPSHSLRVSVGWPTTAEDCDLFAQVFPRVVADLRALRS